MQLGKWRQAFSFSAGRIVIRFVRLEKWPQQTKCCWVQCFCFQLTRDSHHLHQVECHRMPIRIRLDDSPLLFVCPSERMALTFCVIVFRSAARLRNNKLFSYTLCFFLFSSSVLCQLQNGGSIMVDNRRFEYFIQRKLDPTGRTGGATFPGESFAVFLFYVSTINGWIIARKG